ncbi:MAG: DUF1573 domain-containing protein [Sphingobacteriales bacterium]|nr:MAG: DUF1573 domain-containing protein [Sphingobacteriales bacterium]
MALLFSVVVFAQVNESASLPVTSVVSSVPMETNLTPVGSGPVMEFESTDMDYGTIVQGSEPLRVFKFTNTGNEPLTITSAKGSCGCTVPTYPKEPILPGETKEIEVRYDTNRLGSFQKTVTLNTNETENSTHVLKIHGTVNAKPAENTTPTDN